MDEIDTCKKQDKRLQMKYINLYGKLKVNGLAYLEVTVNIFTFLHHEHSHHPYNFHFRKNRF